MEKRKYTKTLRAEKQDETRNRIVEALVALHEELGAAKTSVKAVAEKAGVQRLTVYRHFPDEASMFEACTSHYLGLHPPPSIADWENTEDPEARSHQGLLAFYKYYSQTHKMWSSGYRDVQQFEALEKPMNQFEAYLDQVCDDLVKAWKKTHKQKKLLQITLRHALRFSTWQSLQTAGLSDEKKTELVKTWLSCIVV